MEKVDACRLFFVHNLKKNISEGQNETMRSKSRSQFNHCQSQKSCSRREKNYPSSGGRLCSKNWEIYLKIFLKMAFRVARMVLQTPKKSATSVFAQVRKLWICERYIICTFCAMIWLESCYHFTGTKISSLWSTFVSTELQKCASQRPTYSSHNVGQWRKGGDGGHWSTHSHGWSLDWCWI